MPAVPMHSVSIHRDLGRGYGEAEGRREFSLRPRLPLRKTSVKFCLPPIPPPKAGTVKRVVRKQELALRALSGRVCKCREFVRIDKPQ
jgi:hypothetical protein